MTTEVWEIKIIIKDRTWSKEVSKNKNKIHSSLFITFHNKDLNAEEEKENKKGATKDG